MGVADFVRLAPTALLDGAYFDASTPAPEALAQARDQLEQAARIDPANPAPWEYLGVVYLHRARVAADDSVLRVALLDAAADDFARALSLRSNSGTLWAAVVTTRGALLESRQPASPQDLRLRQQDLQLLQEALQHAVELAPWQPPVLEAAIRVGVLHEPELGADARALVARAIEHGCRMGLEIAVASRRCPA